MAYYADMKYLCFILVMIVLPLNADVYRLQDENGRIIYSDQYHPDAELVHVTKSTSYKPPIIKNIPDEPVAEESQGYTISILSPQENEAIWGNDGELPVSVDLQPELNPEKGEMFVISLDGATVGEPQSSTNFTVPIIERGAHTISVSLINEVGVTLATSQAVHFQLHRASAGN
jgi:hypothetical protein